MRLPWVFSGSTLRQMTPLKRGKTNSLIGTSQQSTSSGLSQHILTSLFDRVTGHKRTKQLLSFSVRCCKLLIFPVLPFKGLRAENGSSLTCLKWNIFLSFYSHIQLNDINTGLEGISKERVVPSALRQDYPYWKLRLNPGAGCHQKPPPSLQGSWI